jgi:hypothetical protein
VPADYEKIRDENIARYGWDTTVLELLGQLYSERIHFIFELIQNAEDAGATELAFALFEDRLELRHDGRPFTEADVRGVCGVGQSGKRADYTAIGQFGIGFKSVYAYTRSPRIHSGSEHFRIENYVRPFAAEPEPGGAAEPGAGTEPGGGTLFVFPFDHDEVPAATAYAEISAALAALAPRALLFLRNIRRLRAAGTVLERAVTETAGQGREVQRRRVRLSRGGRREEWLVWARPVEGYPGQRVEIAFRAEGSRILREDGSPLTVFFPTEKQTFLGFLLQGPYRTTPARDNIPEQDPANQALARQSAALLTGVLTELRDNGLLTVEALTALPVEPARFGAGSLLRPLFDATRAALAADRLIPTADGGYGAAGELALTTSSETQELLGTDQLGALYGAAAFAHRGIGPESTPALWRYLAGELGLQEVTPSGVVGRADAGFLRAQPDEWMARFYGYLDAHPSAGREARARPVIRLEDGRQVAPFDDQGRPAVYLPGPAASGFPTVRRAVAQDPAAREFLAALGLPEPDMVAEVLELILPRYRRLAASFDPARGLDLNLAQHDADLAVVIRALDEAAGSRREELLGQLRQTAFLIAENAATSGQRLMPPPALYQRSKGLEVYFDGNPDAWFAADLYGPWLVQLRGMGVRQEVAIRARTPNEAGYVLVTVEFGRNERGLDGFDPAAEIDGLDFALSHPGHARSEYVWNVLLVPNRRLISGVVERSVLASFSDASRESARSAIALAAQSHAWLPGRDAAFRPPGELSLDDLPATYARDEGLAAGLGMLRPVVAEAAARLGIAPQVLWGLSAHPDLVELVERELSRRSTLESNELDS